LNDLAANIVFFRCNIYEFYLLKLFFLTQEKLYFYGKRNNTV